MERRFSRDAYIPISTVLESGQGPPFRRAVGPCYSIPLIMDADDDDIPWAVP